MQLLSCYLAFFALEVLEGVLSAPAAFSEAQHVLKKYEDDLLADDAPFTGLSTFANLPYVHCLSQDPDIEKYDIAFVGAPFDTATTGRPTTRFGPKSIRSASWRISPSFAYDYASGDNTFESWAKIVDCGDVPMTFLDNTVALKQLGEGHRRVSGRNSASSTNATGDYIKYKVPRTITLGGDHTTTLAALRQVHQQWGEVSVIHFDSHIDTWRPPVLGGDLSDYAGLNHGTFLHIAHEEGLLQKDSSIHGGMRAPLNGGSDDIDNDRNCGFAIVTARDMDHLGVSGVVKKIKERVKGNVYVSVDIDVLDPAFAPGTGTAEPGGWTTRELLSVLDELGGLDIVGADVVEVAPAYDSRGEITALAAAEVAHSLMSLMVKRPVVP